jgi:hypothetical protein
MAAQTPPAKAPPSSKTHPLKVIDEVLKGVIGSNTKRRQLIAALADLTDSWDHPAVKQLTSDPGAPPAAPQKESSDE